jgi:hypothetical protein
MMMAVSMFLASDAASIESRRGWRTIDLKKEKADIAREKTFVDLLGELTALPLTLTLAAGRVHSVLRKFVVSS